MGSQQTRDSYTMLVQCWAKVEDVGPALERHCVRHPHNAGPMLGHRRRRWASIGTALGGCFVFAGMGQGKCQRGSGY